MELIDQHTKKIMEGCKERARSAGLRFEDESLEYIVSNRDLLELSPKMMIPTLYDYWVHDVEVLKGKGKYELYPVNPYETVINTRPAISFYNDNNPDWLNVMIFYHVLAHIDFFQNNLYFRHTWEYDFTGQALSDKRAIAKLRAEKNRWVDYVIEFARGIDNLVGYHDQLSRLYSQAGPQKTTRLDYYFDVFLQTVRKVGTTAFIKEIERYNASAATPTNGGEELFFTGVVRKYPEFETMYNKYLLKKPVTKHSLIEYLAENSVFLNTEENRWMKTVLQIVRTTSLFFQPQIRTKIMNEGWASYWHETLFLKDERIAGHEVDYARVNAGVTALNRVGLNPYALGMRLFYYIEEMAAKGKLTHTFARLQDRAQRHRYDARTGQGKAYIFAVRENFSDFMFINTFLDQDFVDRHQLFVAGRRLNRAKMVWEYYVQSRRLEDYRQMIESLLYHPPHVDIVEEKGSDGSLYLNHLFEGKPLINEHIANTLMGIEYLWGAPVHLETSDGVAVSAEKDATPDPLGLAPAKEAPADPEIGWQRVIYTMKDRKLSRKVL